MSATTDIRRLKNNFSRIFDNIGSNAIGLYEEVIDGGLPGLAIIKTSDTFHREGKYFQCMQALKSNVRFSNVLLESQLISPM